MWASSIHLQLKFTLVHTFDTNERDAWLPSPPDACPVHLPQVGGNWHYQAELVASPVLHATLLARSRTGSSIEKNDDDTTAALADSSSVLRPPLGEGRSLGDWCLVPPSDLDLSDRMNLAILQQIINIACNRKVEFR